MIRLRSHLAYSLLNHRATVAAHLHKWRNKRGTQYSLYRYSKV